MSPMRVLVVDDEQLAREELCYQLEQLGDIESRRPGRQRPRSPGRRRTARARTSSFWTSRCPAWTGSRSRGGCSKRARAAGPGLRHRLRPARHRGVRGERRGLPAQAGRIGDGWNRRCSGPAGASRPSARRRPARPVERPAGTNRQNDGRTARSGGIRWPSGSASGSCSCRPRKSSMPPWRTSRLT